MSNDILADDHERGCQGRYYHCSCGYDDAVADEIRRLRTVFRINALRWMPIATHEEIDRLIEGREA